jgi:hypothetical protein
LSRAAVSEPDCSSISLNQSRPEPYTDLAEPPLVGPDDELPTTGSPAEPRIDGNSQQTEPGEPPEQVPAGQPLGQHRCPLTDGEVDLLGGSQFLGDLEPGVAAPDNQHRSAGQSLGIAIAGTVDLAHRRL